MSVQLNLKYRRALDAVWTVATPTTHSNLPCCCQQRRVRQHSATYIPPSVTISKGFATNENTKRPTIVIYPTVSPETVIIPIVSCIIGFPILALLVICCLRRRAKLARDRDRRRNIDLQDHAVSLVRINAIHRFNYNAPRAVSLCSERSISHSIPSLELDTILEETFCSVEV
ncbi:uncharacterized protein LOC120897873 [Anopheles arabiensis]|uniref:uncharacterized protein LOC120897873 n=1 Tax=Anopheles arabiensis TaxID=7173 RepID=UPI001AADD894|nr:uncharacterized protein LOC120897873 [Anopheles arabiensis]